MQETTVLRCHRCLINTGVEKMNKIYIKIRTLTTRCLYVRVNVSIQTIVYTFLKCVRFSIKKTMPNVIAPSVVALFMKYVVIICRVCFHLND
jgi:hypothetical protein